VLCGFTPASSALLSLDGQAGGTEAADGKGCITLTVTFDSGGQSTIVQTSARVATTCGLGSIVAAGRSPSGVPVGQTDGFRVLCPGVGAPAHHVFLDYLVRWLLAMVVILGLGVVAVLVNRRRQVTLEP
jgi:hypothetical protein